MSSSRVAAVGTKNLKYFRSPGTVVGRFVSRRSLKGALLWGVIFSFYVSAKTLTYVQAYSTQISRQHLASSLGSNVGIETLLGVAHHIDSVAGYMVWNALCIIAAAGAIWAIMIATKTLRGEEDSGHWEMLLAGQTTPARATINTLGGLFSALGIIFAILALSVLALGQKSGVNLTVSSSLFFALTLVLGAAEFLAVGSLASQLMAVRTRAVALSVVVFGVFYMLRVIADTTSDHWLLNVTPLGWIEKLQPMYGSRPIWLVPIAVFTICLSAIAVILASKRDLGAGIFADKNTAKTNNFLLGTPIGSAIRLTKNTILGWLAVITVASFFYGTLAKSAVQAITQSTTAEKALGRLAQGTQINGVTQFLGITFFFVMLLISFSAATNIGHIREDEAEGYLDNLIVRPLSRLRWLFGRTLIILLTIFIAGILSSSVSWFGDALQHGGVSYHVLLLAGANAVIPGIFILGIGVFGLGVLPRLTAAISFGAIGWSFLIMLLSSGLNINRWLLDTSLFHHVSLAPAAPANWHTNLGVIAAGCALYLIGALMFNRRDVQTL
jgi:ABC-2 type transport system permease protein